MLWSDVLPEARKYSQSSMDRLLRRSCPGLQSFAAEFRGPGAGSEQNRSGIGAGSERDRSGIGAGSPEQIGAGSEQNRSGIGSVVIYFHNNAHRRRSTRKALAVRTLSTPAIA